MKRRALLAGLAGLPLVGCTRIFPIRFRYRMTVTVDTPEGARSGSSVIEVKMSQGSGLIREAPVVNAIAYGEAVSVVLPGRGRLWALLRTAGGRDATGIPFSAYEAVLPKTGPSAEGWDEQARALARQTHPAVLPHDAYPWLVRFRDERDARSMEEVLPSDLAARFGQGVRLRNIIIQIVDTPPTFGASNALPWLATGGPWVAPTDGAGRRNPLSQVNSLDFRRRFL